MLFCLVLMSMYETIHETVVINRKTRMLYDVLWYFSVWISRNPAMQMIPIAILSGKNLLSPIRIMSICEYSRLMKNPDIVNKL